MTTEQLLFFLKWIIVVLNCEIKTWSISYCNICHVAKQHCVCFGVFFSKYHRWHVSFPLFSRKEPEKWAVGGWSVGVYYQQEKSGKQDVVTRFLSTILVPVTVIFAHKGYHKMGQHVAFGFSIANYGFMSNLTLKERIPRCNKIMSIAVLKLSCPRKHRGYLHCSGVGCYWRCRKLDLQGWLFW